MEQNEITVFDHDNPRSLINIVPERVSERIKEIPPELFQLEPKELEKLTPKKEFTLTDSRLRTAFWIEYGRSQEVMKNMRMDNVYGGICTAPYFYQTVLLDKVRLAYILQPPTNYNIAMEEALHLGVDRLREILDLPIIDENGKPNPKVADVILKTVQMLDMRVKGAIIQRIEQKNLNVSVDAKKMNNQIDEAQSVDEIDRKLRELEEKANKVKGYIPQEIVIEAVKLNKKDEDASDSED
jgi:hypothetical protein